MSTFTGEEWATPNIDPDTFAPTGLDIDQWLDAVVSAGGKYAILITKHHDGFALWPTAYHVGGYAAYGIGVTAWYVANGSPDIVGLFVTKCSARSLNPVLYYSTWDRTYEARVGAGYAAGYSAMVIAQLTELLTNYGNITALWFDGWTHPSIQPNVSVDAVWNLIQSLQPNCLLIFNNTPYNYLSEIDIYEQTPAPTGNTRPAEVIYSMRADSTWFYNAASGQTSAYLKTAATINAAIQSANANGAVYCINVTPGTDGHLPAAQVTILGELVP